jgi:Sulfatase-modifying factor enzyme 1
MRHTLCLADAAPLRRVPVDRFWMDRSPVTNVMFQKFIAESGHVTFAEIPPNPADYPGAIKELLAPGGLVFIKPAQPVDLRDIRNWWHFVLGADWRHPRGPNSSLGGLDEHPVVQIAYADAEAYWKPSGNSPHAADWLARSTRGEINSRLMRSTDTPVDGCGKRIAFDGARPTVGRLDKALDEAIAERWTVVSMKDDWKTVFAQ